MNNLINSFPIELHLPGYPFCGPGRKLEKRLQRGDRGINQLDAACRVHDTAYAQSSDVNNRHQADKELVEWAWTRVQKMNAYLVTNAMKAKVKFDMGMENQKTKKYLKQKILTMP